MNKFLISMVGSALLLAQTVAAAPAKLLGPDPTGRPKIKIMDPGKYYIFHSFDGAATTCDAAFYVKTEPDSDGLEWCRTINRYPKDATLADPVPFAVTRLNSPVEVQYRVGTSPDIASSQYVGWSPKKSVADDRIQNWLGSIQTRYAIVFQDTPATLAGHITTTNVMGAVKKAVVTYSTTSSGTSSSTSLDWYFYYNDKYVALFNHRGGLVALTHTAYGDDMIYPAGRSSANVGKFNEQRALDLQVVGSGNAISPQDMPVPVVKSDGSMELTWTLGGNDVTVNWLLTSLSSKDQPSGLSGSVQVENTAGSDKPLELKFPIIFGLTTGGTKQLYIPAQNSGTTLISRSDAEIGSSVGRGDFYPSPGWQAQFIAVATTDNDGMLISANDPDQFSKAFNAWDNEDLDKSAARTQLAFYPQDGSTTTINTNGSVTLSPMHGNWAAAAAKYRSWAIVQKWGAEDDTVLQTTASKDIDETLKKGVYWWSERVSAADGLLRPTAFETDANRQKAVIGETETGGYISTGFHLSGWWDRAFDTNYPQFNAIEDGAPTFPYWVQTPVPAPTSPQTWSGAIDAIQYDGSLVAPYINAVGVDMTDAPNNVSGLVRKSTCVVDESGDGWWTRDFSFMSFEGRLKNEILRDRNGVPFSASFGNNCRTFAFADPTLQLWWYVLYDNMSNVFSNLGSNGIYLDSFANANTYHDRAARPVTEGDFADPFVAQGVPAGRGSWMRTGYRGMGTVAREAAFVGAGPDKFIAAEFFSEVVLPFTDIVMDYHDPQPNELPIVQATFGDYQLFAGQRPKDNASIVAKKAVVGRSFLWGNQLGLSWYKYYCRFYTFAELPSPPCSDSASLNLFDYTRTLAKAREEVQDLGLVWVNAKFIGMFDGAGTEFEYRNDEDPGEPQDDWCFGSEVKCPATVPQLRGALWSSTGSDEPDFLVLTNTAEVDKTASFPLPPSWASRTLVYGSATVSGTNIELSASSVAVFKATPVTSLNTDGDGEADSIDEDDDNDGVPDISDAFPRDEAASVDTDNDKHPDAWNSGCDANCRAASKLTLDTDNDEDGVLNTVDNCPLVKNASQTDIDSNGVGDICQHGLTVSYFNDSDTASPSGIDEDDAKLVAPVVLQRIEANINFNYGISVSPGSGVNHDYFSSRFTGRLIVPSYTGVYTFCLTGDDGVRLWINNVNLFLDNNWEAQNSVKACTTMFLIKDKSVPIKMEFFDLQEEAIAKLEWSWSGHTEEVVPTTSFYAQ